MYSLETLNGFPMTFSSDNGIKKKENEVVERIVKEKENKFGLF